MGVASGAAARHRAGTRSYDGPGDGYSVSRAKDRQHNRGGPGPTQASRNRPHNPDYQDRVNNIQRNPAKWASTTFAKRAFCKIFR